MEQERNKENNNRPLASEAEVEEAVELLRRMEAVDKERGYRRIVRPVRLRLRRVRLWWRVAAVAAVFAAVAFGVGIWRVVAPEERMPVASLVGSDTIVPGRPTARLILADRREVLLDTLSSSRVALASGVSIRREGTQVVYEVSREMPVAEVEYNELVIPRGGEYDLVLEDGTRVWMNADSRLRYPVAFGGGERRVYLEGEAYFEVERDNEVIDGAADRSGLGHRLRRERLSR